MTSRRGIPRPFLIELARDEKIGLVQLFDSAGDQETLPYLDTLAKDPDTSVAEEGLRSLKALKARL